MLFRPAKLARVLPKVRARIDAIWAENDRLLPNPALQAQVLRQVQPDVDFRVLPEAEHLVMYEQAQAFNLTLREFLGRPLCAPRPV
jgi:pimeloyl-ACP methyl ester carboxylesterase